MRGCRCLDHLLAATTAARPCCVKVTGLPFAWRRNDGGRCAMTTRPWTATTSDGTNASGSIIEEESFMMRGSLAKRTLVMYDVVWPCRAVAPKIFRRYIFSLPAHYLNMPFIFFIRHLPMPSRCTYPPPQPSPPRRSRRAPPPRPPATAAPQIIRNDHIMPLSSSTAKSPGHHRGRSRGGGGSNNASSSLTGGATATTILPTSLVKQCLQLHHPDQRYTNDAIELSSEFLRLLVIEARRRAAIEVSECVCHHYSWKLNASIYLGRILALP